MERRTNRYVTLPDVRDGLTELERVTLYVMYEAKKEYGERMIPTALLWGRVSEYLDVSPAEVTAALASATEKVARFTGDPNEE